MPEKSIKRFRASFAALAAATRAAAGTRQPTGAPRRPSTEAPDSADLPRA
jgi:hypothetical protein